MAKALTLKGRDYDTKMSLGARMWKYRAFYFFLLPAIIWYAIFCYYPMYGVLIAFKNFKFNLGILGSDWVGLRYFKSFLGDPYFWTIVKNTLVISLLKLFCGFPAPIILALFINEMRNVRYKKLVQTLSYLPHFVSWVVVVALLTKLLSPNNGAINELRQAINPNASSVFYLGEPGWFYPIIVLSDIWKNVGWGSIIYLAALKAIVPEQYEAADLDGANPGQKMGHITLPGIYPTIGILMILSLSGILNAGFDQVYLLQKPSTLHLSEVLDTYVLKRGLQQGQFAYSTAVGIFRSVISMVLIVTVNGISRRTSEVSLW
ncbi:MAG: sugar ABC transporter permease [Clostridiales bacterium]|nr:sugar ABC transporter permease [Clostridiales bacterium]